MKKRPYCKPEPIYVNYAKGIFKKYKPGDYLFEGQFENEHLSTRSIQQVLQNAKEKSGIKQDGSMHMLRHSFATPFIRQRH